MYIEFTVDELRKLWGEYHNSVHTSSTPCDANEGDPCFITSFFDWLEIRDLEKLASEKRRLSMLKKIFP